MIKYFPAFFIPLIFLQVNAQQLNEKFKSNETLTYPELINAYKKIDSASKEMKLLTYGETDGGFPIHLLVINKNRNFERPAKAKDKQVIFLIMNGIHPGECDGIDASLLFAQKMAYGKLPIPENVTICIIPVYNVDGMINRRKFVRTNQNGPVEKGFRGNAQNMDLNRDFIKADTKNTFVFYKIYHEWNPDVFLDNHTSNGADYQYTMTLITTQREKLGGESAKFLHDQMKPALYAEMKERNWEMVPYVHLFGKTPDEDGYEEFIETPKFSTGYTALFGTLGFIAETHMLKPYPDRVESTLAFMESMMNYISLHATEIRLVRRHDQESYLGAADYETNFSIDKSRPSRISFKGFEAEKIPSKLGSYNRTFYNRDRPFTKEINYYNLYKPGLSIRLPAAYIVPKGWHHVIDRLKANQVEMKELQADTMMELSVYYVVKYESSVRPYEGHHTNAKTEVEKKRMKISLLKGDYLVTTRQTGSRYVAEVLEPQTEDGFFSWNFFDGILNPKEGFSDYVFEDDAVKLLDENPMLKSRFEEWKVLNPDKSGNSTDVLNFIYSNSYFSEPEYKRFPVYRLE